MPGPGDSHRDAADARPPGDTATTPPAGRAPGLLARELTGDLPCIVCRYNLRGLSIRAVCPECGTAVRATLLALVDPHADELKPIRRPVITAAGLLLWSGAQALAALVVWVARLAEVATLAGGVPDILRQSVAVVPWLIGLAGVGALVLVRPHAGMSRMRSLAALVGVLAYAPLTYLTYAIHVRVDGTIPTPYIDAGYLGALREMLRTMWVAVAAVIVLALQRNLRMLIARSLVIRTGRIERQTPQALLASLGVMAAGSLARLAGTAAVDPWSLLTIAGTVLVAVGAMLFTLGLVGVLGDCVQARTAIVRPPLTLGGLTGESRDGRRRSDDVPAGSASRHANNRS